MVTAVFGSTNTLRVTVANAANEPVVGATVTVAVYTRAGVEVLASGAMDAEGTEYVRTIGPSVMPVAEGLYEARVTAVSGGLTRYAAIPILNAVDRT